MHMHKHVRTYTRKHRCKHTHQDAYPHRQICAYRLTRLCMLGVTARCCAPTVAKRCAKPLCMSDPGIDGLCASCRLPALESAHAGVQERTYVSLARPCLLPCLPYFVQAASNDFCASGGPRACVCVRIWRASRAPQPCLLPCLPAHSAQAAAPAGRACQAVHARPCMPGRACMPGQAVHAGRACRPRMPGGGCVRA